MIRIFAAAMLLPLAAHAADMSTLPDKQLARAYSLCLPGMVQWQTCTAGEGCQNKRVGWKAGAESCADVEAEYLRRNGDPATRDVTQLRGLLGQ